MYVSTHYKGLSTCLKLQDECRRCATMCHPNRWCDW